MPTTRQPRRGSLQYWPRKRAGRMTARVRFWDKKSEVGLLGFAGYKVGMSKCLIVDNKPESLTKNEEVAVPVTVIECPPMKIAAIRFYKPGYNGMPVAAQLTAEKLDKDAGRRICLPKKQKPGAESINLNDFADIRVLAHTQPRLIGFKKKPEMVEIAIGGKTIGEKFDYAKQLLGKAVSVQDVLKDGQQLDVHCVTKGKGLQGPTKRFGLNLRQHKSEKGVRGPGNVGPWTGNRSWTVAHAGQMGFHMRTEYNKWLLKIMANPADINPAGGFVRYGPVRNPYLLVKGSIGGPAKRMITLTMPIRPNRRIPAQAPTISYISK